MQGVVTLLRVVGVLAELFPEVEEWLMRLSEGDQTCREQLLSVIGTDTAAEEMKRRGL
jgi:hypothetical protein